jgi:tetratricopeptide (TPR) repeat protein
MQAAIDDSRQGQWKAAAEGFRRAVLEFPGDVAATHGLARSLLGLGQLPIALKAFQRALYLAPADTTVLTGLADVQERLGLLTEAAATYQRMASLAARSGELQAAAEAWVRATRLAPDQLDAYRRLVEVLERLGRPSQAAAECATLASIYERRGNRDLAIESYREALRLDPGNDHARARLAGLESTPETTPGLVEPWGFASLASGSTTPGFELDATLDDEASHDNNPFLQARRQALQGLAETLFLVGSEDAPKPAVVNAIGRAIDQQTRGQIDEAIASYREALDGGFNRTALYFNLGALYYERHYHDKAIETFRHSMRDKDYRLGSHYALGLTYQATGMLDRALEHFLEVVKAVDMRVASAEQLGEMGLAYQQLTDAYLAKQDIQKTATFIQTVTGFFARPRWERHAFSARRDMDRLTDRERIMTLAEYLESPETEVIVTSLSLTDDYMRRNMLATAVEECLHAIDLVPDHLPLYVRLADIQMRQDQCDAAVTTQLVVTEVYEARNQLQPAIGLCHKILRQTPMEVRARTRLVQLLLSQDGIDRALEQYMALADTYYQLAEVDRALETYDAALRLVSKSPQRSRWETAILHRMGDIFVQRVDWARAAWAYESIVAHAPADEGARLQLIDLHLKQGQRQKALQSFDRLMALYDKEGKASAIPSVLKDLMQAYPEEMALRARVAATYAAHGWKRPAVAEYSALSKMQLQAGLRAEACRTLEAILSLGPEQADQYRRLLNQLQSRGSESTG